MKTQKKIVIENVPSLPYVRHGVKHEGKPEMGHHVELVVGESVRLYGRDTNRYVKNTTTGAFEPGVVVYDLTFKVGDVAEYDSYNMHYTGKIVSIGAKTIGILPGDGEKVRRLSLHEFSWRNKDLDLDKIAERNLDVMMHT